MELTDDYSDLVEKINNIMIKNTRASVPVINNIVNSLIGAGGKRLRGLLVVLSGNNNYCEQNNLFKIAAAVEILHMATLVHDDIIDEAQLRRGRETIQKNYNKNLAVLCGDFLYNRSFRLFSKCLSEKTLNKLHKIEKSMCEGEALQNLNKFKIDINTSDYIKIIRRKTGLFFAFSTYAGAYEKGIRDKLLFQFYNLGLKMGIAYQIQDDILDYTGSLYKIGKTPHKDLKDGIFTLPVILLLQNDKYRKKVENLIKNKGNNNLTEKDIEKLIIMIRKTNSLEKSEKFYKRYLQKAYSHYHTINKKYDCSAIKDILDWLFNREKLTKLKISI